MRRVFAMLLILFFVGQSYALPSGIDGRGDKGCLCHGGGDDSTIVELVGLPDIYNSSMIYNITVSIDSPVEQNEVQGGFRLLISHGEIIGENWQYIDNGYTHSTDINDRREWNAVWIPPSDSDVLATFVVHGNAVNGDGTPQNDEWNSQSLAVPGPDYTGDIAPPELSNSLTLPQKIVGVVALILLLILTYYAVKD